MDDFRRQLDALMGTNRNGDKPGVKKKTFTDNEFCKHYIAGLCPNDLLTNTVRNFLNRFINIMLVLAAPNM
jgi:hypothetical protein